MPKTSGADLQQPSTLTFLSLTSGKRHRAHSFGILPIYTTYQTQIDQSHSQSVSDSQITIFHITSPDSIVENLTISEQAPAACCLPFPKTFPGDGEREELLFSGNVNTTSSPGFTLLPLLVDSPETSLQPTNHHSSPSELSRLTSSSSTKPSPESQTLQSVAFASRTVEFEIEFEFEFWFSKPFRFEEFEATARETLGVLGMAGNSFDLKLGVSKIMLIAAVASFLAKCRALIMSMSEYSEPTMDRTVDKSSSVTLFPI